MGQVQRVVLRGEIAYVDGKVSKGLKYKVYIHVHNPPQLTVSIERVANSIWNANTDHDADIRPAGLLWLQGHGLCFTVKPQASRGIHAMYDRSC